MNKDVKIALEEMRSYFDSADEARSNLQWAIGIARYLYVKNRGEKIHSEFGPGALRPNGDMEQIAADDDGFELSVFETYDDKVLREVFDVLMKEDAKFRAAGWEA